MKTKISLKKVAIFSTPAIDAVILVLLFLLTAASQEYFYENVTKYTLKGNVAYYMSWLVPFVLEAAAGVVIFYVVRCFGRKAYITSLFLLGVFFTLVVVNYNTSQSGLISKGLDEIEQSAPEPMKRLKEVEDKYLEQIKSVSNNYQIISTSNIDRQINAAEEDLAAIQTETDKCRCPAWSAFQNTQKAKKNAILAKISRLEDQRISIQEQNNLAQKMQAQQTAPIQEAMRLAFKKAEEENKKEQNSFEERKSNKTQTIASIHTSITFIIVLLTIVKGIVKDQETMLLFEKSFRTSLVSKPAELKSKKPIDFKQDFEDLIFTDPEYLRLTDKKIAEKLSEKMPIDGELSALSRNINTWRKLYENQNVDKIDANELPEGIKQRLQKFHSENKSFAQVKAIYMNGEYQKLLPEMELYWGTIKK